MPNIYKNTKGKRVKGTTTFIGRQCAWGKDGLNYWFWKEGAEGRNFNERSEKLATSGTFVHDRIDHFFLGKKYVEPLKLKDLGEEAIERYHAGWASFEGWVAAYKPETIATEQQMVDDELGFGGMLDWVGKTVNGITIIDWKHSKYANHIVQISSYRYLWNQKHPDQLVTSADILKLGTNSASFAHAHIVGSDLDDAFRGFRAFIFLDDLERRLKKFI